MLLKEAHIPFWMTLLRRDAIGGRSKAPPKRILNIIVAKRLLLSFIAFAFMYRFSIQKEHLLNHQQHTYLKVIRALQ
jgi:hypothetical protein